MKALALKFFIFLIPFVPLVSLASNENISQIDFTTDSRGVSPNEISETITIQTQNSSGESENLSSTADATLRSSSGTGKFYTSSGVEDPDGVMTMSSGSANKNFKYSDSTEGTFTISATVKIRDGSGEWTASQSITVGQGANTNNPPNTEDDYDNNSGNNTTDNSSAYDSTDDSSHSGTSKLSTYTKKSSVKVGAGRPRTVLVNTPIYFEPETSQVNSQRTKRGDFIWSFGDGSSDSGRVVKHMYYFPGEYNVVLNTKEFGEDVVSRTKVKVIEPSVEIVNVVNGVNGYVEIKNNNSIEVNINGWDIKSGKRHYSVSEDTIINPKSSIKIPNKVMAFDPVDQVSFIYPNDELHMVYEPKIVPVQNNFAYVPPVYYSPVNNIEPNLPAGRKENILPQVATNTPNLNRTANVSQAGFVGKLWGGLKSLFLVH